MDANGNDFMTDYEHTMAKSQINIWALAKCKQISGLEWGISKDKMLFDFPEKQVFFDG
jgi:hypothetical protein